MRTRTPETLLSGLMWFGLDVQSKPWEHIRHECDQGQQLVYGWEKHDGQGYGRQRIKDSLNNIEIVTEFVKVHGMNGGDWVVRVTGTPIDSSLDSRISLIYYMGFDHDDGELYIHDRSKNQVHLHGSSKHLGEFSIFASDVGNQRPDLEVQDIQDYEAINLVPLSIPPNDVWKIKGVVKNAMVVGAQKRVKANGGTMMDGAYLFHLNQDVTSNPNVHLFQHMLQGEFRLEYSFVSNPETIPTSNPYTSSKIDQLLKDAELGFDEKFGATFGLEKTYKKEMGMAKHMLSNMIGSVGYFYGNAIVDASMEGMDEDIFDDEASDGEDDYFEVETVPRPPPNPQEVGPLRLFTGVPSRPFFPRGFLWDSGFDSFLISAFHKSLSMDIISFWASLIDQNGWVAREQILGEEARSKVPSEFQTQYPHYANPPIMVAALERHLSNIHQFKMDGSDPFAEIFVNQVYPKFRLQYEWFLKTQSAHIDQYDYGTEVNMAFKWRGRKGTHILTSGLDDYPRSKVPHPGDIHVDLQCWMVFFAKTLEKVADHLGIEKDVKMFQSHQKQMMAVLENVHWDENSKSYTDITFSDAGELVHIVHKGYLSILPLALEILPTESEKVGHILDLISDSKQMWSPYGICSLSKSDVYFGTGENYWRGPIWMNINYLVLQALHKKYMQPGPYQSQATKVYTELRDNIISNVYKEYQSTGFIWEQYSCTDGKGSRSHPFTGWTSLVLLIMAEKYQ